MAHYISRIWHITRMSMSFMADWNWGTGEQTAICIYLIQFWYTNAIQEERERARDLGLSVYRNPCQQTADWRMSELYEWCTKTRTRLLLTKINVVLLWNLHSVWLDSSGFVWSGFNMRLLTVRNTANELHDSAVKLTGVWCLRFYMAVQSTHITNIMQCVPLATYTTV
jgi:hypothetical protein